MDGKFLSVGEQKLFIHGVTYGTFRPTPAGDPYPHPDVVNDDFARMAANGVNAVRAYTPPPRWLLDLAHGHGLRVMVGLPWEQHVAFLDDDWRMRSIEERVRAGVRACSGHPAVLAYAVGNEIPVSIVRWYGRRRVERFLRRLYLAAKSEDPEGLVTYVDYPSTDYPRLPFVDFTCFNVYLETPARYEAYLARLQNLAGERPVVVGEIGLDSRRHGEDGQAEALRGQIRSTFAGGAAGTFVFAWTDEWHRGGYDIEDWDFGLTTRDRRPKPALAAVREAFAAVPFPADLPWPRVSVVVCSHNGSRLIADALDGLANLKYPDYEVIVVDDGSTDRTADIAASFGVSLIRTPNRGLSSARNTGLDGATGEIVAYLDDDARPDPHWLTYLAAAFLASTHAGVCGPNLAPPGDGPIAECVANAPGGPTHVLVSDREAEHLPGCNMAFRKSCLDAIGGFDPRFRVAGDDVDVCWRLRERGWTLGFSPAAVVWHHRRNSLRAFWKQQRGYGRAEALLERKWPEKFNAAGHLAWGGRLYGKGLMLALGWRREGIYQGTWGMAPYQSECEPEPGIFCSLLLLPEWYLVIATLVGLAALGAYWPPLFLAAPLALLALGAVLAQAIQSAARATFHPPARSGRESLKLRGLTVLLYLLQPLARLRGRLANGLSPWRRRGAAGLQYPWPRTLAIWSERWQSAAERLGAMEKAVQRRGACVLRGGPFDRWDLAVRGGMLGAARLRLALEEHGAGAQLVRLRVWPRCSSAGLILGCFGGVLSSAAAFGHLRAACVALGAMTLLLVGETLRECAGASAALLGVIPGDATPAEGPRPAAPAAVVHFRGRGGPGEIPEQGSPNPEPATFAAVDSSPGKGSPGGRGFAFESGFETAEAE